ncbi:hypothetical protein BX070DRAFT_225492 [Coemansia spiralis]|nr:hypothetical protein BX070DRAFT_225492 [Coemansia spiralis]
MGNNHSTTKNRAGGGSSRRAAVTGSTSGTNATSLAAAGSSVGSMRRDSIGIGMAANVRRPHQISAISSQAPSMRAVDFPAQRTRPATARSRLSHGPTSTSLKDPQQPNLQNYPYSQAGAQMNDSRISLLSMVGAREGQLSSDTTENNTNLSLSTSVNNIRSSRVLSNPSPSDPVRPRSRTQSSEQGIVTVFSGVQKPPPLDPDLDAINRLPKYRPLVLAPSNNRLAGLFHSGYRYIEPTAEQLKLDETELTGICFSFRDYITNRVQHICDRQVQFVNAAKYIGARTNDSNAKLMQAYQVARRDQEGLSVLKSIQRQTEKSYELVQQIIHDLERLEAVLPAKERFFGADSDAAEEFPYLAKMLGQRRRHSLPASSPHSSAALRRQIAGRKAGIPVFPPRSTSASPQHSRSGSLASYTDTHGTHNKPRPGPYQLPTILRQSTAAASNRPYSRGSIMDRHSQSSLRVGSSSANNSAPVSPISDSDHRVSFDGEAIHPSETTSLAVFAAQNGPRSVQKRNALGNGMPRRPVSALSAYIDPRSSHARGEVSLSTQQVLWSPQMSLGANESAFGYPHFGESSPQLVLAGVEEEYELHSNDQKVDQPSVGTNNTALEPVSGMEESASVEDDAHAEEKLLATNNSCSSDRCGSVRLSGQQASSLSPAKGLQLRVPLHRGTDAASPKSLPRGLSLRSGSSMGSSPSTPSIMSPTPIGSPSVNVTVNPLSVVTVSDAPQTSRHSLSPQFPSEATRMLKQAILERSDSGSTDSYSLSINSVTQKPTTLKKPEHALLTPDDADIDTKRLSIASNVIQCSCSRSSSLAHSQPSTVEEASGLADRIQPDDLTAALTEAQLVAESTRTTSLWARGNTERMSTWSSSSAKTLADGIYGSRVPSIEDPLTRSAKQQLLSSSALSNLSASAAMVNRPPRSSSLSVSNTRLGDISTRPFSSRRAGGSRHPLRTRAAVDLGLSIRSDLERRVRSFSESESDSQLPGEARPHSSMGFHETVSGAQFWSARPDGIHARRNSPHSASLRLFRSDRHHPHRISAVSVSSGQQSIRKVSISSDQIGVPESAIHGNSGGGDGSVQSDASSILSSSYSSQATERLFPTPPSSLARPSSDSAASAVTNASAMMANKRRAQTMSHQLRKAL